METTDVPVLGSKSSAWLAGTLVCVTLTIGCGQDSSLGLVVLQHASTIAPGEFSPVFIQVIGNDSHPSVEAEVRVYSLNRDAARLSEGNRPDSTLTDTLDSPVGQATVRNATVDGMVDFFVRAEPTGTATAIQVLAWLRTDAPFSEDTIDPEDPLPVVSIQMVRTSTDA